VSVPFAPFVLLFLAFVLPLFGPVSNWIHVQLSVPVFAAVMGLLYDFYNANNMRGGVRSMEVPGKSSL